MTSGPRDEDRGESTIALATHIGIVQKPYTAAEPRLTSIPSSICQCAPQSRSFDMFFIVSISPS